MANGNERVTFIDQLRGIAIFCVVAGHFIAFNTVLPYPHNITIFTSMIGSFNMPLFFVISGFVSFGSYKNRKTRLCLQRKVQRLFIPYIMWSLLAIALRLLNGNNVRDTLFEVLICGWSVWYLLTLFICSLSAVFISKAREEKQATLHFLVWIFIILLPKTEENILALAQLEHFYPFFVLGYYLNKKQDAVKRIANRLKLNAVAICLVFFSGAAVIFEFIPIHCMDLFFTKITNARVFANILFSYIWALTGCLFGYVLAKRCLLGGGGILRHLMINSPALKNRYQRHLPKWEFTVLRYTLYTRFLFEILFLYRILSGRIRCS
ncbi:MAG: acyltransferase [Spirochaetaceae bacterium]|jgi:fucose 4-O-acetylase-like acetyltransferase|nr:acyltransferase [Spirochaetaceae bacterium]